ncbi:MAG TPA: monovalent cation:proton antiporter-2 (CPA2) family protein [Chthoniobacteraceae bacterium]|jgi:monovalent cation:proton antiporter-2 (CPA2) family protein
MNTVVLANAARDGALYQSLIYLLAMVVAVPVAKRLGLGSVLGYLVAGMLIGPFALGLIGNEREGVMHVAEMGVVMMLFLIGLELRPALLWQLRGSIFGMGGLQVAGTMTVVAVIALALGVELKMALAIGAILAMSSTAIVLQSLNEKRLIKRPGGEACFAVLLFQDIAVIPMLALLPLLRAKGATAAEHAAESGSALAAMPQWQQGLITLGAVAAIIFIGRVVLRHVFRFIAGAHLREAFTATALLLLVAVVWLMELVGVSPALGAFLGGVVLADSEYRPQLEADVEPFKGLLLGLFFVSVGSNIDFALILRQPLLMAALVGGLVMVKWLVLFGVGRFFRLTGSENSLFAFALAQGGEFAFVLFSLSEAQAVLPREITSPLTAAVALSMALAPLLLIFHERVVQPRLAQRQTEREADMIDEHDHPVILAGFGRFGHVIGRLLRANGYGVTVLDHDGDQVDTLRKFGMKSFYGDATREDLLEAAGIATAKLFIIAIDDEEQALRIVDLLQRKYPHVKILARAVSRQHAYEFLRRNVTHVHRETLGSSLDLTIDALHALGMDAAHAARTAALFREHDDAAMREMALLTLDKDAYASNARKHIENLERLLRSDRAENPLHGAAPISSSTDSTHSPKR